MINGHFVTANGLSWVCMRCRYVAATLTEYETRACAPEKE